MIMEFTGQPHLLFQINKANSFDTEDPFLDLVLIITKFGIFSWTNQEHIQLMKKVYIDLNICAWCYKHRFVLCLFIQIIQ